MRKSAILLFILSTIFLFACGNRERKQVKQQSKNAKIELKDGMLYGLACEGCNDTFIVVIPTGDLEAKPVKLNVMAAFKRNKVIGVLEPGDWCAIMLNKRDSTVADMVINMDLLKGKWVHLVMPEEKENARTMILHENPDANVDSIINSYMIPVERGFELKRQGRAASIGVGLFKKDEQDKPVTYPAGSSYASWKVVNGLVVFSEADSIVDPKDPDMIRKIPNRNCERDTCELVLLLKDSLQISYQGKVSSYYRKK